MSYIMNLAAAEVLLCRIDKLLYIFYIPSTSSGTEPVEGLNIPGPDLIYKS